MRMLRVTDSSNVAEIGYEPDTRVMRVRFVNGSLYEYLDVGAPTFVGFATAKSVGSAFTRLVKGKYKFVCVEKERDQDPFEDRARAALQLIASIKPNGAIWTREDLASKLDGCVAAAREALG